MTHTELSVTAPSRPQDLTRVVVLMPGLGTAVTGTWNEAAGHLDPHALVIALDLPGHHWACPRSGGRRAQRAAAVRDADDESYALLCEALAAAAEDAQVHILRGAAHQGPTEKPAEVAALLNEFFT